MTRKPLAVLISDIHFNINNLELSSEALKHAMRKAHGLDLPLIIAGDLLDTKAIIRGEVANKLLAILLNYPVKPKYVKILAGNHDLINEKSSENSLHFLNLYRDNIYVVDTPQYDFESKLTLIPYMSNSEDLIKAKSYIDPKSIVIMHQGFLGASMGDYIQDKSSVSPDLFKDHIVFSGHYHRHQTIGTITYIGSPFTHTWGEANDGPKGYLVIYDDGTYEREILPLRKHVKLSLGVNDLVNSINVNSDDLLWVKINGTRSELATIDKSKLGNMLIGHSNFKLDLIPLDGIKEKIDTEKLNESELLDKIIDNLNDSNSHKEYLKKLWRELL